MIMSNFWEIYDKNMENIKRELGAGLLLPINYITVHVKGKMKNALKISGDHF
jgi:hypothetical protein